MPANNTQINLKEEPILLLGDLHGQWGQLLKKLEEKDIKNHTILCVGDLEIGTKYHEKAEIESLKTLNKEFSKKSIDFLALRGNHDNPRFFDKNNPFQLSHLKLLPDYTLLTHRGQLLQVVGGATSIDRMARMPPFNYWPEEKVSLEEERCQKVHTLLTHTAPSQCHPAELHPIVKQWAQEDPNLIPEIQTERKRLSRVLSLCQPKLHIYGHFHSSHQEKNPDCQHILLDILEIREYPYQP